MTQPSPQVAVGACSVGSAVAGESAFGSAATAAFWVALEQPGPWGRQVATESHLDPALGARLDREVAAAGGRFVLLRAPGAHADDHHRGPRRVLVASCRPGREWLLGGSVGVPQHLADLDLAALAAGDREAVTASAPVLAPGDEPQLLVCTNGRRDVCCAVRGRPVAQAAAAARPGRVWETSHTGGHRFAPTGVLLPSGQTLARLDGPLAVVALDAAGHGRLPAALHGPVHDRGRSALPAPQQAAESGVRAASGEERVGALTSLPAIASGEGAWTVGVRHLDGRTWQVDVRRTSGPERAESCAKAPVAMAHWTVRTTAGAGVSPAAPAP